MRNGCVHPISLYASSEGDAAVCLQCQRRCRIEPSKAGYCRTVINTNGVLYSCIYGLISSSAADPIEKKPLYHFKPGSLCYSVGSLGCNFRCDFCQNWQIAYADPARELSEWCAYISPQDLVRLALRAGCEGIAWTYNEPSIWYDYTRDCAELCKQNGLYTVYVTNGYATREHLDGVGPYLDAYRVDIKSIDTGFYRTMASVPSIEGIFAIAERAKHKWGMHVECVTNVVPGENDSNECLIGIARWIAEKLGKDTPWHITRFFPYAKLDNLEPTPISTLKRALSIAKEAGLTFAYLGNIEIPGTSDTLCPTCSRVMIERHGYRTVLRDITKDGSCAHDGTQINVRI